jgi:hypothetical protein
MPRPPAGCVCFVWRCRGCPDGLWCQIWRQWPKSGVCRVCVFQYRWLWILAWHPPQIWSLVRWLGLGALDWGNLWPTMVVPATTVLGALFPSSAATSRSTANPSNLLWENCKTLGLGSDGIFAFHPWRHPLTCLGRWTSSSGQLYLEIHPCNVVLGSTPAFLRT